MGIKKQLQDAYLDYTNDYLTIAKYAEHNELTVEQATILIWLGKAVHEDIVEDYKLIKEMKANKARNTNSVGNTGIPQSLSLIHKPELTGGYCSLESLAKLKGFHDIGKFNVHYVIYYDFDADDKKFYTCEKRSK